MSLKRRQFLLFLGTAAGTSAFGAWGSTQQGSVAAIGSTASSTAAGVTTASARSTGISTGTVAAANATPFQPLKGPMPYEALKVSGEQQPTAFAQYAVQDDIVLPDGFTYDVIASWGDAVGDSRFGYNNDYLSFVPTGPDEGYLTINFEYVSSETWAQTYPSVIGKMLPVDDVIEALKATEGKLDAFALPAANPLKAQIKEVAKEALLDQGMGVISVRRQADGQWVRVVAATDRRISGISGLEDGRYLKSTGPATAIFTKTNVTGYSDGLGAQVIGTFGNCAGGTTPWGTALSAEENFQDQVPEAVYSDGSAFSPSKKVFDSGLDGQGNVLGLAGNKYGWIVEVDPSNPNDYGTKHTWLGRYRHEAVGVRAEAGKQLAFYSGCDRRGGHLYKFISTGTVSDPSANSNSGLLADGMLYAAKFNPDGTGEWIALTLTTPVNPILPSSVVGGMVTLPQRPEGGFSKVEDDAVANALKANFATLGDLYEGSDLEKQGAILIDAHFAATAAGATTTARPEDTDVAKDGTLFIAFTSGTPGGDGGPDKAIFVGPNGEAPYESGWVMKLIETDNEPAALTFSWSMFATGGEPATGGLGFANPDNLEFDNQGNLWVVTDMSTSTHNNAVTKRTNDAGEPLNDKDLLGLYGNNSLWQITVSGQDAGEAKMFAYGPMESELTGPYFTADGSTLFLAAQHPGERNGIRSAMATETREFQMKTTTGQAFMQKREVPVGSNWPAKSADAPPKPSVVAIRRIDGGSIS
ncbi:MAG: phosphatase [Phormidesmis priestleyi]|uniref:Phosphatase n=1 Tax=Phormidesmis priestleyi TaxID=268141 RepID=A0A2W4XG73_9CYAN|nr:MAG: phosphatase [Phormidesmis priestleyi]